jgi:hypothetical protein
MSQSAALGTALSCSLAAIPGNRPSSLSYNAGSLGSLLWTSNIAVAASCKLRAQLE